LLMATVVAFFVFKNRVVKLGLGVKAAVEPEQINITSARSFQLQGFTITPLAEFHIKARLLSKKYYRYGKEAQLFPIDLA